MFHLVACFSPVFLHMLDNNLSNAYKKQLDIFLRELSVCEIVGILLTQKSFDTILCLHSEKLMVLLIILQVFSFLVLIFGDQSI